MRRFFINFRHSAREQAAVISARAYNHYLRLRPIVGRIYKPIKEIHSKYLEKFYGKSQKGTGLPR